MTDRPGGPPSSRISTANGDRGMSMGEGCGEVAPAPMRATEPPRPGRRARRPRLGPRPAAGPARRSPPSSPRWTTASSTGTTTRTSSRTPPSAASGPAQLAWAARTFWLGVYQPLAWLLFEAQYAACGLDPRGYHLTSLALHAANAVALFALILALLDRCRGRSPTRCPRTAPPGRRRWPPPSSPSTPCGSRPSPGPPASPTSPAPLLHPRRPRLPPLESGGAAPRPGWLAASLRPVRRRPALPRGGRRPAGRPADPRRLPAPATRGRPGGRGAALARRSRSSSPASFHGPGRRRSRPTLAASSRTARRRRSPRRATRPGSTSSRRPCRRTSPPSTRRREDRLARARFLPAIAPTAAVTACADPGAPAPARAAGGLAGLPGDPGPQLGPGPDRRPARRRPVQLPRDDGVDRRGRGRSRPTRRAGIAGAAGGGRAGGPVGRGDSGPLGA